MDQLDTAKKLEAQGKLGEAEYLYQRLVNQDPKNPRNRFYFGRFLVNQMRFKEAERQFEKVLHLDSSNASSWYYLGNVLYFQKRPLEAEKAYKQAVQFNPSLKDALYNLGTVLLELEKWSEAEGIFERVLELDQQNIEALHNLGVVKLEQGRFREAEEPLTQVATQLATTNTLYCPAWFNLGEVLFNLNRIEEAQRAYEKANLHSPFDWQYKKEVKNILYQLHAYTGPDASYNIKELILQALELSNRGKSKLAIEIFKTSNKMTPKNPIILLYWANELDLVGEKSEAEKKLNEAIQMDVDLVKEYISFRQEGSFQETTIWESSLTFWMAFKGKCKSCETIAQSTT